MHMYMNDTCIEWHMAYSVHPVPLHCEILRLQPLVVAQPGAHTARPHVNGRLGIGSQRLAAPTAS